MFIFLDTETTGTEEADRLCQLAYKTSDGKIEVDELFHPGRKIEIEAMCVHHITDEMVADKPSFKDSPTKKELTALLSDDSNYVVAHNAKFDIAMLNKEGIFTDNVICSLKIARYLDSEGKFEKYNLQYLRYRMKLNIQAIAHDAFGDILVLEQVFYRIYFGFYFEYFPDEKLKQSIENSIEMAKGELPKQILYKFFFKEASEKAPETIDLINKKMVEISKKPSLLRKMFFGKHKGELLEKIPKDYLSWLASKGDLDEDLEYTVNYYLNS
ncbi:MAG: DUF3820 family protein [Desulfobacter sp.]|nr:MAG: DUF3820 family protein [Desulfobacter sp.]